MKNFLTISTILFGIVSFYSCIYESSSQDITIINNTNDSLYYYIHGYKSENKYTWNIAYNSIDSNDTNRSNSFNIAYNINEYKILPHDTLHPSVMNSSWKRRASRDAGLTVIFYKREIEHLPKAKPLAAKDIFRRIDLTPKQLDSLKYKVELKSH